MEYITIKIPAPDFDFSEAVKSKAKTFIRYNFLFEQITTKEYEIAKKKILIVNEFDSLISSKDKVDYINELFTHILNIKLEFQRKCESLNSSPEVGLRRINDFQYFLYSLLSPITGGNFNSDAFSDDEVVDLNEKLDNLLSKLEKLEAGQEVIYDSMDELKVEIKSLKTDYLLGKKNWHQRATGIIVSYAVNKGANVMFQAIEPEIKDLLFHQVVPFVEKLLA